MIRTTFTFFFGLMTLLATAQQLKVSADKRFLIYTDGKPFFYLGDTAWELFHRLNREEADQYLEDRAAKGFTVIQAVALAELDGLTEPNPYGKLPLRNNDPAQPNDDYFEHVDYVITKAESLGMFVGLLPTWGDKWNKKWGVGPEIFTPENARVYGEWLGNRYKNKPVIWILGGDRIPETDAHRAIIRAMAEGIRKSVGTTQLLTFHPMGGHDSSEFFHTDNWLDFNMFQSGHDRLDIPNYEFVVKDIARTPAKPVLDGEPRYEDHPINWKAENGYFDDFDVRQAGYWSMLSGASGHTYGDHNIWQFWQKSRKPISAAHTPWDDALSHPGSMQMGFMRRLFESRPWQQLVPDQSLVTVPDSSRNRVRAARAADGSFLFVYVPNGETVKVNLGKLTGKQFYGWWFNPKAGVAARIGKIRTNGQKEFDAPGEEFRGNDWVLVIDDIAKNYPTPGSDSGQ
jgi:hypothetical protein